MALRKQTATLLAERQRNGLKTVGRLRQVEARQAVAEDYLLTIDKSITIQAHQLTYLAGAGPDRALSISAPTST